MGAQAGALPVPNDPPMASDPQLAGRSCVPVLLRHAAVALSLAFGVPVTAQVYVPDARADQGPINSIPLGGKGPTGSFQDMRTQILVPASAFPPNATITDVGFATAGNGNYTYSLLELRMAHLRGSALDPKFDQNLADPTLLLRRANTRFDTQQDAWARLGLTGTFRHDGQRAVVVDLVIQDAYFNGTQPGSRRSDTLETVYALAYDAANPVASGYGPFPSGTKLEFALAGGGIVVVGSGCPKADQQPVVIGWLGEPKRKTTLTIQATAMPATAAASLLVGASETSWSGVPLPLDLAPLGAPGCLLRTDVLWTLPASADAGGNAAIPLPIPDDPNLKDRTILFQWLAPAPKANALERVVSAMLRVKLQ